MQRIKVTRPLEVRIPNWMTSAEKITAGTNLVPDRLRAVTHQFFLAWIKDKRIKKDKRSPKNNFPEYFPVYSPLLQQIGSEKYTAYVKLLEEYGIIFRLRNAEGRSSYKAGSRSTLFRWQWPDPKRIPFRREQITDHRTIKSVLTCRDKHFKDAVSIPETTTPQENAVFDRLRAFTKEVIFLPEEPKEILFDEKQLFVESIVSGEAEWHKVCEFGNRYHTHFTSLPKTSRRRIRFKGFEQNEPIILDFANSQPYISSVVGQGTLILGLAPEFIPLMPLFEKYLGRDDFRRYSQLCAQGHLYDYLTKYFEGKARKELQLELFKSVLFAKKKVYGKNLDFKNKLRSIFPSLVELTEEVKGFTEADLPQLAQILKPANKLKNKNSNLNHKILSCLMQRIESRLMFRHIAPRMIEADLGPFLTIHDALLILPQYEAETREIIANVFSEFGVPSPLVKTEPLSIIA